jgi:hypothetical protein
MQTNILKAFCSNFVKVVSTEWATIQEYLGRVLAARRSAGFLFHPLVNSAVVHLLMPCSSANIVQIKAASQRALQKNSELRPARPLTISRHSFFGLLVDRGRDTVQVVRHEPVFNVCRARLCGFNNMGARRKLLEEHCKCNKTDSKSIIAS